MFTCVNMLMEASGQPSSVILWESFTFFYETRSSLGPRLADQARQAGQQAPGIFPSLPPSSGITSTCHYP